MKILIKNIKGLLNVHDDAPQWKAGKDMAGLPVMEDAWMAIEDGVILDYGEMKDWPGITDWRGLEVIDARDKFVLPAWIDSHTHLVFAGNREGEFVDRIKGLSYEEIANRGGGILNSAKRLREASEEELLQSALGRLVEVQALGTGAIEIKSGYGLTTESELKMLRVAKKLKDLSPVTIKTTFLGAHAIPAEFKDSKDGYVDLVVNEMIPRVAEEGLADFIDIFCEKGYFDLDDTHRVLEAGVQHGLIPKTHVNQFNAFGGVGASVDHGALSVDHLEELADEDIDRLKNSKTMPVALPSCSFFLSIPYTPARKIIDAGLPLALATDYNPGSTPSGNMNFVVALASIKMKMLPEEAINAATINGAYALGLQDELGTITRGKRSNLIITKEMPSYAFMSYAFGSSLIDRVIVGDQS